MTKREQLLECRRELDKAMIVTGMADHVSQVDVPKLIWGLCKAVLLLMDRELRRGKTER